MKYNLNHSISRSLYNKKKNIKFHFKKQDNKIPYKKNNHYNKKYFFSFFLFFISLLLFSFPIFKDKKLIKKDFRYSSSPILVANVDDKKIKKFLQKIPTTIENTKKKTNFSISLFDVPHTSISSNDIGDFEDMKSINSINNIERDSIKTYTIQKNDNLWRIANKENLNIDSIISLNKMNPIKPLQIGKKLQIPYMDGIYIKTKKFNNINEISKKYSISKNEIKKYNKNIDFKHLNTNQTLFLRNVRFSQQKRRKLFGNLFTKPIKKGTLTSRYGFRIHPIYKKKLFHSGIDISSPINTPIHSTLSGRVIFAGEKGGYGNLIIIKGHSGYETYYGHLNKISVKAGDRIRQNQVIGLVGSTGISTGPHLHFEIRQHKKILNPTRFLDL